MGKLNDFSKSLAASNELLNNAIKNGSFIEWICLESNQIDALLRMGLIYRNQLDNNMSDIDLKYLYQGENDKTISEKQIYGLAKEKGVIDEPTRSGLYLLYEERNKVIHRYIISEITTKRLLEIALEYTDFKEKIKKIIEELEKEQIEKGVGMTIQRRKPKKEISDMISKMSVEKHGFGRESMK